MVRKQLYLEERHERGLKRRAAETGLSEAELVRRALDAALAVPARAVARPGRADALERLHATWAVARSELAGTFDRSALYGASLEERDSVERT